MSMMPVPDPEVVLRALMRQDLSSFIQRAAMTVDPGIRYAHNWHIDAIAWHLEEVARGNIRRLIITMPPRCLKSVSASVAFPAWLLGQDPRRRIVCVSYAEGLADKFALDCQKVMEAPWYRAAFPRTRIARGRSGRSDYETTCGGGRFSTSVGGTLTGRGGGIIIIDDPHKPDEARSEAKRSAVIDWYRSTLLSRLDDPANGPIILIQQRVHEADLAGTLLEAGGWVHLDLSAIAEEPAVIPLGWRGALHRKVGDLLHEARLPRALLEQRRSELGSYVFAAQYQQRPAPIGGGLIKWEWFRTFDRLPDRRAGDRIIQSWDTASKAEEANDYSVCTTWLVRDNHAWLVDVLRLKLEFPELRRRIVNEAHRHDAKLVLIEEAGSGLQLLQEFRQGGRVVAKGMKPRDDKATRLMAVSHLIEGGAIAIPEDAPWMAEFRREISMFPNGKYDDQVDSVSQFLRWFGEPKVEPRIRRL